MKKRTYIFRLISFDGAGHIFEIKDVLSLDEGWQQALSYAISAGFLIGLQSIEVKDATYEENTAKAAIHIEHTPA